MSDRRLDEPSHLRAPHSRARLKRLLAARVAALGLSVSGAALMAIATLDAPAPVPVFYRLVTDQTLVPLPAISGCDSLTVPGIVTSVSLPTLADLSACTSTHTTALTSSSAQSSAVGTTSASSSAHSDATSTTGGSPAGGAVTASPVATPSSSSRTAAGVLGSDAGTPSTGTDIAFGIGIGLVIAGAGVGTGTGAFLKRRRSTR